MLTDLKTLDGDLLGPHREHGTLNIDGTAVFFNDLVHRSALLQSARFQQHPGLAQRPDRMHVMTYEDAALPCSDTSRIFPKHLLWNC